MEYNVAKTNQSHTKEACPPLVDSLVDLLRYRAAHQPDQQGFTFLVDGETETLHLTYAELDTKARAIAAALQSVCTPGDRALLVYQPGLEYICAFFGCLYAGVIAVPIYPPRPNRSLTRLQSVIADSHAIVALTTHSILSKLERQLIDAVDIRALRWLATDSIDITQSCQAWQEAHPGGHELAFLQYTSGSTATPKGVMITHHNLLHNLELIYQSFEHSPESQGVIWLPPYHDMGLIGGILQPLYGGFPVVLMSPFIFLQSPIRWLQAISRYQATTSGGPNFAYDLCLRKIKPEQLHDLELSSWQVAFNGAEPISAQTLQDFATTFKPCGFRSEAFFPCYGLAEATLIVSGGQTIAQPAIKTVQGAALEQHQVVPITADDPDARTLVGCGSALQGQQIVIADPETLCQCSAEEVGEIWVAGDSIAQGYWQQTDVSAETFHAYLADTSEGPFLRTGDYGFVANAELFVTGRLKDVIIINGRNHYPQDIEWTVIQSYPGIRPNCAAAFSISVGSEERLIVVAELERNYINRYQKNGKKPLAHSTQPTLTNFVPPTTLMVESEPNAVEKEILAQIRRAVAKEHDLQIHSLLLLKPGTIPKTSSGKIQRFTCKAKFLDGTLENVTTSTPFN
ncbi:MAG: fatty acyl-AMP ligase [Acaryochloris sp. RU_4_1]|nr:fatty acyl-AMP ligase [Acaryochloris sp. RU_4_1]NJR56076.1 fatty acyl-AMP ligase [Acaryochloris sp. CRU_2_0]